MIRFVVLGWCLVVAGAFAAAQTEDARRPVPTADAVAKVEKTIKEIFRDDYQKTKPADRSILAAKLLENAEKSDEAVSTYVFLREARDIAARAGDLPLYQAAVLGLSRGYRIDEYDALAGSVDVLASALAANGPSPENARTLVDLVDDAVRAGDFTAAQKLLKGAETVVRKAGAPKSSAAVAARMKSLPALQKEFAKLAEAQKTLDRNPSDRKANDLVGRFACFVKNDWDAGLARLLLGAEGDVQRATNKDVAALTGKTAERIQAGDEWKKLAAAADPFQSVGLEARALHWYRQGVDGLTGLEKIRVEKLIGDLQPAGSDWADLTRQMNDPKNWRASKGWSFDGKAFHGEGTATQLFLGKLPNDCMIQLQMVVRRGQHFHIYLGESQGGGYYFCNEGKKGPRLKIRGKISAEETGPGHVVKANEEFRVKIELKKDRVTAWVNDTMASTAVRKDQSVRFGVAVGTGKNEGSGSFWDFKLSADGK
jgi:hypothetical protein